MDTEQFDAVDEDLDYPMFVVTTVHDGTPAGCLVGFTTQASIDPPRMLVCLSNTPASCSNRSRCRPMVRVLRGCAAG